MRHKPPATVAYERLTPISPRIAVVSTAVPPAPSGQARVLGHLLGFPPAENCLLMADQSPFQQSEANRPEFVNYRVLAQRRLQFISSRVIEAHIPQLNIFVGALHSVFQRAHEISIHARDFNASALVACTANPFDIPACTLVSVRRRVPLIVYLFDDPIYQWVPGPLREFARLWEPIWGRVAKAIIVPNEALQEEITARRRRQPVLVRNPVPPEAFASVEYVWPANAGEFRIVYTGSVYHAQLDAFLNLLGALEKLDGWTLHIYTSQTESELSAYGILGPKVFRHDHVDQADSYARQQAADVLFLPLAFRSKIQDVLLTSAPMKMAEYLASGRPILAHAPPETFIVRHLRAHRVGTIVDVPDSTELANALRLISLQPEARRAGCDNAVRLAENYSVARAREAFWNTVMWVA